MRKKNIKIKKQKQKQKQKQYVNVNVKIDQSKKTTHKKPVSTEQRQKQPIINITSAIPSAPPIIQYMQPQQPQQQIFAQPQINQPLGQQLFNKVGSQMQDKYNYSGVVDSVKPSAWINAQWSDVKSELTDPTYDNYDLSTHRSFQSGSYFEPSLTESNISTHRSFFSHGSLEPTRQTPFIDDEFSTQTPFKNVLNNNQTMMSEQLKPKDILNVKDEVKMTLNDLINNVEMRNEPREQARVNYELSSMDLEDQDAKEPIKIKPIIHPDVVMMKDDYEAWRQQENEPVLGLQPGQINVYPRYVEGFEFPAKKKEGINPSQFNNKSNIIKTLEKDFGIIENPNLGLKDLKKKLKQANDERNVYYNNLERQKQQSEAQTRQGLQPGQKNINKLMAQNGDY